MHSVSIRRIQQLEERANTEEHNPRAQADYLRVSNVGVQDKFSLNVESNLVLLWKEADCFLRPLIYCVFVRILTF